MTPYCFGCKRLTDVVVFGDWYPPWALCPECAARASGVPSPVTEET